MGHERAQPELELPGSPPNLIPGYQSPIDPDAGFSTGVLPWLCCCERFEAPNIYSWLIEQLIGNAEPSDHGMYAPILVTTNYNL